MAGVIDLQRRAIDTNELAARIDALETWRRPTMSLSTRADERPAAFFGAATVGVCNQSLWSGDGNKKHQWMRHRALPVRTPQLDLHMPSLTKFPP